MATKPKVKPITKPTVFLSHSSANRRELLGLKRLLDERAGGLIEFFLSSDDESIPHGTIWPAEVRAALDRMSLMLVFVSTEALKSPWTYFEAGYGLHKLGSAKVYCLPATDKGSLPPPFNILQNRNLHSPREVGLLIKQCNERFGASMRDTVSQEEFDRIFKRPMTVQLETGPKFEDLVERIAVQAIGPANSAEILKTVCHKRGFSVSAVEGRPWDDDMFVSTGLRLTISKPDLDESFREEIPISDKDRQVGTVQVNRTRDDWESHDPHRSWQSTPVRIPEVEEYNTKVRVENEAKHKRNEIKTAAPRRCEFELAPTNLSIPVGIVDDWVRAADLGEPIDVLVYFHEGIHREPRIEAITSKIHGSELSLRSDGLYQWRDKAYVNLRWVNERDWSLGHSDLWAGGPSYKTVLSEIQLPELVASLFELNIISFPSQRAKRPRK